jgi:hypothetical protein
MFRKRALVGQRNTIMGAYNIVADVSASCPQCQAKVSIGVQFKFGATWQYRYVVGDALRWGRNDVGTPGLVRVVADGAADGPCPACGYASDWDFYVLVERDHITGVTEADGTYDFVRAGSEFLMGTNQDPQGQPRYAGAMMDKREAQEMIRLINEAHKHDRDGGYALAAALKRGYEDAAPSARAPFSEALADLVRAQDPQLCAVALEALVQLGARREVASLGEDIAHTSQDEKWKDNVVLGLLRLEQGQFRDAIVGHLRSSLESPRTLTMPIMAALCRIDPGTCLDVSSAYFTQAHVTGHEREAEGLIPAFVRNFTNVQDHLLAGLVQEVSARDSGAGRWLAHCLNEYLSKPWILEEFGAARSTRVRAEICEAAQGVN